MAVFEIDESSIKIIYNGTMNGAEVIGSDLLVSLSLYISSGRHFLSVSRCVYASL